MAVEVADLFATLGLKADKGAWEAGTRLVEGLKKGLEFFAVYEVGKKIGEAIDHVVELGTQLDLTSQKTGLSVEALQEYGYIAKQNGADTERFAHGVTKLARGLDEAATKGAGPAAEALQRIGLSLNDPAFKNATLDDKIRLISEHLQKFPDGVTKTALAMDLFGKSGAELIPTLNAIAEHGGELREEFKGMGGELSGADAKALHELDDQLDKLKTQFGAIWNQIAIALVPTLLDAVDAVREWMKENKELIAGGIKHFVDGIIIAFRVLGFAIKTVLAILEALADLGVFDALEAGFNAVQIVAMLLWEALKDIWDLIKDLFATAVGASKKLLETFRQVFAPIKAIVADVVHWITEQFRKGYDLVKSIWDAFTGFFISLASSIKGAFEAVIDWITDKVEWAWDQVKKIGHVIAHPIQSTEDFFGGDDASTGGTPGPVTHPQGAAQPDQQIAPVTVNGGDTTVIIHAASADAREVADIVDRKIIEHHDKVMRDADAAGGGKDIDQ